MSLNSEVVKVLEKYGKIATVQAKSIIKKKGAVASGELYNNIKFDLINSDDEVGLDITAPPYWEFINDGVKGSVSSYPESKGSKYKYRKFLPKKSAIEKWMRTKGIKGRDKKTGRFIKQDTALFFIRRSINRKGIKAVRFDKAFDEIEQPLINDLNKILPEEITFSIISFLK